MDIKIDYAGDFRFLVRTRGHECALDLPRPKGGSDVGPTPPELLVGALGACIGVYLVDYCERADLPTEGLSLEAGYRTAERPSRISDIQLQVNLPAGIPQERQRALHKVAESCLVHNTLLCRPDVAISFDAGEST
jgi:uncharacterized OsmC-like protein